MEKRQIVELVVDMLDRRRSRLVAAQQVHERLSGAYALVAADLQRAVDRAAEERSAD